MADKNDKKINCCDCDNEKSPIRDKVWEAQLEQREIIINGEITSEVVEKVIVQIQNINQADDEVEANFAKMNLEGYVREPITVIISSNGGSVDYSFAVVDAIEASKTLVKTVAIGRAMSGGFLILLAGDRRYAQKNTSLMYHELSVVSGGGKATEITEYGEYLNYLQNRINSYVLRRTKIHPEQLEECHVRKVDWYMGSALALELGVIDELWGSEFRGEDGVDEEELAEDPKVDKACPGDCSECNDCE